jgi:hypothetical protein
MVMVAPSWTAPSILEIEAAAATGTATLQPQRRRTAAFSRRIIQLGMGSSLFKPGSFVSFSPNTHKGGEGLNPHLPSGVFLAPLDFPQPHGIPPEGHQTPRRSESCANSNTTLRAFETKVEERTFVFNAHGEAVGMKGRWSLRGNAEAPVVVLEQTRATVPEHDRGSRVVLDELSD